MFDNDQLIARFGAVSDAINKTLEESPKISDIPDDAYETDELQAMISANYALLQAVRQRQLVIELIAEKVRKRIAEKKGSDSIGAEDLR